MAKKRFSLGLGNNLNARKKSINELKRKGICLKENDRLKGGGQFIRIPGNSYQSDELDFDE